MRILLVEDDHAVSAGIAGLLTGEGHEVHIVHLGEEAVAATASFNPDVVLLDVRLPDVDGSEVFKRLRARWQDLAVVFSSGHVNNLGEVGAEGATRVGILRKPYESSALFRALADVTSAR